MGNGFGHVPRTGFDLYFKPEITPSPHEEPTFDPLLGFESGRKERVMIATEEEMRSAKLPLEDRDYCAHSLLKFRTCRRDNFPWVVNCSHEKHEYLNCKYDDFVIRMKEYEREKRLRIKQQKENAAEGA
ncbi:NADH dehydrogenase (ubiquinone) B18 subunit [Leptinotarsa decemlineata]|uniref:NADH dehydrogenase (ubiquinone) B18 subunit n=1 Tax=Leptinotarsa decemlineata TaxID=7539 RepID=UPI000C251E49|nr:NADH dehydrogenase [ubiquinone] 1 beta subcomplex subunit 7 [Leptinotarsa decemlineata]